jgi:hypothetical protein
VLQLVVPYYKEGKLEECCDALLKLAYDRWTVEDNSVIDDISFVLIFLQQEWFFCSTQRLIFIDKMSMNICAIAEAAFEPSSPLLDYRQLYEETKKKVGIFIARV